MALFVSLSVQAQAPTKLWDRTLGGTGGDGLEQLQQTPDGGYILGGSSSSGISGDKTQARPGFWLVKLDANGRKLWDRAYGSDGYNTLAGMQQLADGGYVLAGTVNAGISGDKTEPSRGSYDYWIIRVDAAGNKLWDRTLGGADYEWLSSVKQTTDGGFVLGGRSYSGRSGDKSEPSRGLSDYWVVKLDGQGQQLWDKTLGGPGPEEFTCLDVTTDGGCLVGGISLSGIAGDKTQPIRGTYDYWVVKLSATGTKQWDRTVGGSQTDVLTQVRQTPDGGYLLAGFSESDVSGERTEPRIGGGDYWVVKLDAQGAKQWDSTLGSTGQDELRALALTADGGYLLGGDSTGEISAHKSQPSWGFQDVWVVKLDGRGRKQWDRTLGGSGADQLSSVQQTQDLGFVLGGSSSSGSSIDKTEPSRGGFDMWVIRLGSAAPAPLLAAIRGDSVLCSQPLLLTATSSAPASHYQWSTGATTPTIQVTQPGVYSVVLSFAGGATARAQRLVTPFAGSLRISGDTILCPGSGGQLAAHTLGATSYYWSTGDSTARIRITQPGTYAVTAYYGGACAMTRQVVVGIPSVRVVGPGQLCAGGGTTLTAQAPGAAAFVWNTGATTATLAVTQPGTYRVEAYFATGCRLTASYTITQVAAPVVVTGDSLLCVGGSAQLTATTAGATAFRWSTGATTATIAVSQPGLYTVQAIYSTGCSSQTQVRVRQLPGLPTFTLGPDTTLREGQPLVLRGPTAGLPSGTTYLWSDGSTGPELLVQRSGLYTLRVSTSCGTVSASRTVTVAPFITVPTVNVVSLPNVITPNGDQRNDYWVIKQLPPGRYTLDIYSRWGRLLYHDDDYRNTWGPGVPAGTYSYQLRHTASKQGYRGWIEVLN